MNFLLCTMAAAVTSAAMPADTTLRLGSRNIDLTGDGQPEALQLVGSGDTVDSLNVTFLVTSAEDTLYRRELRPLTRVIGFDAGRRVLSRAEHRERLDEFGDWFFGEEKFRTPAAFVQSLERRGTRGAEFIEEIPTLIAEQRVAAGGDSAGAARVWEDMKERAVTTFTFSRGGDAVTAISWSVMDQRFYHLWRCC